MTSGSGPYSIAGGGVVDANGSADASCAWLFVAGGVAQVLLVPGGQLVPGLVIRHISRAHPQLEMAANSDRLACGGRIAAG